MQTNDGTSTEFRESSEQSRSTGNRSGQDDGESSEAAGFVRGLVRTCQVMIRRVAVGQVPVRRVAKISDVTSNAIDLASNMSEARESHGSSDSSSSSRYLHRFFGDVLPRKMMVIAAKFVGTLIKNTLLGAAVFETYERSIDYIADENGEPHRPVSDSKAFGEDQSTPTIASDDSSKVFVPDSYAVVSVPGHFVAGAAAGAVHSALSIAMDCASSRSLGELRSFVPITIHHSIAHSVLFGGYEWTKRSLAQVCDDVFISSPRYASIYGYNVTKIFSDEQATVYGYSVMVTALAGGTAGVMQHVCSHYTGMWLGVETTQLSYYQLDRREASAKGNKEANAALRPWRSIGDLRSCLAQTRRMFLPAPGLRPTLLTFPTFAVAFLAFEYGKDVSAALVDKGAD